MAMGGNSNNGARWYLAQSTPAEAPRNTCGGGVLSCRYTAAEASSSSISSSSYAYSSVSYGRRLTTAAKLRQPIYGSASREIPEHAGLIKHCLNY